MDREIHLVVFTYIVATYRKRAMFVLSSLHIYYYLAWL